VLTRDKNEHSRSPAQLSKLLCALAYFGPDCQPSLFGWLYQEFLRASAMLMHV